MFDCVKCKNKDTCTENSRYADDLQKDMADLSKKYKHFYGRIDVDCDYFIDTEKDIGTCCNG